MRGSWVRTTGQKLGRRLQMGRITPTITTTEATIFRLRPPSSPPNSPTLRIREGNHDVGKSRRASRTKNRREGAGAASGARPPRPPETRSPLRLPGFRLPTRLRLPPRRPLLLPPRSKTPSHWGESAQPISAGFIPLPSSGRRGGKGRSFRLR